MPSSAKRRATVYYPFAEPLGARSLLTTIVPFQPPETSAYIESSDLYELTDTIYSTGPTHNLPAFEMTVLSSLSYTPVTLTFNLNSSVSSYVYASLIINTVTYAGYSVSNYHENFNTGSAPGDDNSPTVVTIPAHSNYEFAFNVGGGDYAGPGGQPTGAPPPPSFSYEFDVNVQGFTQPQISITSFAKDQAATPLLSDGDYDLTYQVSGANLPNNPELTLAVYWATGTTAASIIPGAPPVATGQLQQATGTYLFPVQIAQLINPPANATNLVAVLDSNHILLASEETNSVAPLSTAGAPPGYTWLNAPLSFELQTNAQTIAPPAPTREQRVFLWLQKNAAEIRALATNYDIDPVGIAGAIAWEALQNVVTISARSVGPGKIHWWAFNPFVVPDALFVEGNTRYRFPPPKISDANLVLTLMTADGAIHYVAAILDAYATEAQHAGGPDFRHGFYVDRAQSHTAQAYTNASILDSYYVGEGNIVPGQPSKGVITLQYAPTDFKARLSYSNEFVPGSTMGQWVAHNDSFLRLRLGCQYALRQTSSRADRSNYLRNSFRSSYLRPLALRGEESAVALPITPNSSNSVR